MKKAVGIFLFATIAFHVGSGQVKIGDNPGSLSPGSVLELESTNRALTLPRMTTVQMQAIPSPLNGMIIFNIDSNCIYLYKTNNVWASISADIPTPASVWPYHTNDSIVGTKGNKEGIISLTGSGLVASGDYSHAEGVDALSAGTHSFSFGLADTALGAGSVAIGFQNKTAGDYSLALGKQNITAYQYAVALGQENQDSGWASLAMGLRNAIYDGVGYSNILGYNNKITAGFSNNVLGESNAISQGRGNTTMGFGNTISAEYSSLMGYANKVLAGNSHVAGGLNNTIKSGTGNTVFGLNNFADGLYLGAIGRENNVFFQSAVALGQGNKDSGYASITGGLSNVIEKNLQYAISFGYNNTSTKNSLLEGISNAGSGTFSAGISNVNSGFGSVALGSNNRPSNFYSLSANSNTVSNSHAMSAFGHYNDTIAAYQGLSYEPGEMLFSIGNGNSDANRRNSFTMLRNGFTTINATENLGANVPRAELDVRGTGAMIVPVGTSAQRPETPVVGMIRVCSDCGSSPVLQGFDGSSWVNL